MALSNNISQFVIFHRRLGCDDESATDEEQHERILYFYPEDTSVRKQLSTVSMLESLIEFTNKFSKDPLETILMEKLYWAFYECEPSVYMAISVRNETKITQGPHHPVSPSGSGILAGLWSLYKSYFCLHGSISGTLASLDGWESIRRVQQLRRRIRKAKSSLSQTRQDLISLQYRAADAARSKKPNTEEFQETLGLREGVKSIAELSTEVATAEGDIENMMNDLTEALKSCEKPYTPLLVSKYLKRFVSMYIVSGEFQAPSAMHLFDGMLRFNEPNHALLQQLLSSSRNQGNQGYGNNPLTNFLKSAGAFDDSSSSGGRMTPVSRGAFVRTRMRLQDVTESATHGLCTGTMVIRDGQLLWTDLDDQTTASIYRLLGMQDRAFTRRSLLRAKRGHVTSHGLSSSGKSVESSGARSRHGSGKAVFGEGEDICSSSSNSSARNGDGTTHSSNNGNNYSNSNGGDKGEDRKKPFKKMSSLKKMGMAMMESIGLTSGTPLLTYPTAPAAAAAYASTGAVGNSSGGGGGAGNAVVMDEDQVAVEQSWAKAMRSRNGFIGSGWHTFDVTSVDEILEETACASTTVMPHIPSDPENEEEVAADADDQSANGSITLWCPRLFAATLRGQQTASKPSVSTSVSASVSGDARFEANKETSGGSGNADDGGGDVVHSVCIGRALIYRQRRFIVVLLMPDWVEDTPSSSSSSFQSGGGSSLKDSGHPTPDAPPILPVSLLKLCLSLQHGLCGELDQLETVFSTTAVNSESESLLSLSLSSLSSVAASFFTAADQPPSAIDAVNAHSGSSTGANNAFSATNAASVLNGVQLLYHNNVTQTFASSGFPIPTMDVSLMDYPAPLGEIRPRYKGDTVVPRKKVLLCQPQIIAEVPLKFSCPPSLLAAAALHPRVLRAVNDISRIMAAAAASAADHTAAAAASLHHAGNGRHGHGDGTDSRHYALPLNAAREVCQLVHLGKESVSVPVPQYKHTHAFSSLTTSVKKTDRVWVVGRRYEQRIVFFVMGAHWHVDKHSQHTSSSTAAAASTGGHASNSDRSTSGGAGSGKGGAGAVSSSSGNSHAVGGGSSSSGRGASVQLVSPALNAVGALHGTLHGTRNITHLGNF